MRWRPKKLIFFKKMSLTGRLLKYAFHIHFVTFTIFFSFILMNCVLSIPCKLDLPRVLPEVAAKPALREVPVRALRLVIWFYPTQGPNGLLRRSSWQRRSHRVNSRNPIPTTDHREVPGDLSGYEAPGPDDAMAAEAAQSEVEAFLSGVDSQILSVKGELEKLLASTSGGEATRAQSQAAMDCNIVGVGIGLGNGTSMAGSPGDPVLEVFTRSNPSRLENCAPGSPRWRVSQRSPTGTSRFM